jgi:hypothetical protein
MRVVKIDDVDENRDCTLQIRARCSTVQYDRRASRVGGHGSAKTEITKNVIFILVLLLWTTNRMRVGDYILYYKRGYTQLTIMLTPRIHARMAITREQ